MGASMGEGRTATAARTIIRSTVNHHRSTTRIEIEVRGLRREDRDKLERALEGFVAGLEVRFGSNARS